MNIPEKLKKEIIDDLKISTFTPDYQDAVLKRLEEVILDKANLEVIKSLSEEKRNELEKLLAGEDDEQITNFFISASPNFLDLIEHSAKSVVSRFKELKIA